jgi:hypothetical protein
MDKGESSMRLERLYSYLITMVVTCLFAFPALAVKPGYDVNPNGFPSGEHYNLNIHGKKLSFQCPEPKVDEYGNPVYGGSIFIPEDGQGIQIIMESGSSKGKRATTLTEFGVKDACTADFDGDAAVLQLPPNDKGYRVYARPLAKPTDEPSLQVMPELLAAVDEFGNDLIYLGLVTDSGFESEIQTFTRKKGKSKAVDITGLFQWSGDVCYFSTALCEPIGECTQSTLCCTDEDFDGVYESCEPQVDGVCLVGTPTDAYCKSYVAEWVFSIADFVQYLWDAENRGLKLLNVRFYPNN